jgi:hypothetical protein
MVSSSAIESLFTSAALLASPCRSTTLLSGLVGLGFHDMLLYIESAAPLASPCWGAYLFYVTYFGIFI